MKLTELAHCSGCAAKLPAGELSRVLGQMPASRDPRALVGFASSDDAAVYRLTPTLAVVQTADFFPPLVDDPFAFGQIAAANAISDIYAMGARPLFALNLVGFPNDTLPLKTLSKILAGGQSKANEAHIAILGGHSIQDREPKYGLSVTGVVHPKRVLTNRGARAGDLLILTKPIGSGIAATAIKRGVAPRALVRRAIALMTELNKNAGEAFASKGLDVHALTDVTGFGLLGHLWEMMRAASLRAKLHLERVPLLEGIAALAAREVVSRGTRKNLEFVRPHVTFPKGLPQDIQWVLADAQTNGGLLASVPRARVPRALALLERHHARAAVIGEVVKGRPGIEVV